MGKVNKRNSISESHSPNSPKKIKLDKESLNCNSKTDEQNKKSENHKLKKKREETSNAKDSDSTITSNSDGGSDNESNHSSPKKISDLDKKGDASDGSSDSEKDDTTDRLVIDLDEKKSEKKMQTVDSLLEIALPSSEELKYRTEKQNSGEMHNFKTFTCTKCNFNFEKLINKSRKISVHPLLGILMCEKCCNYYGDGDFSLDSDNEDKYCRWCGEGGTIFACSNCICGFCKKCISKHFGKKVATEIESKENWSCYFCNIKPLWELRYICSLAQQKCEELEKCKMNNLKENKKTKSPSRKKRKRVFTRPDVSSSDSDSEWEKNQKKKKVNINVESTVKTNNRKSRKLSTPKKKESTPVVDTSATEDETDNENKKKSEVNTTTGGKNTSCSDSDELSCSKSKGQIKKNFKMMTSTPKKDKSNSDSCDSSSFNSKKRKVLKELENILKLTEYQMSFGSKWSSKKLAQISKPANLKSEIHLKKECQKIKWFLSTLCSYIVGFSNSVDSIEKSLTQEEVPSVEEKNTTTDPSYDLVLKFLSFTSNLVKVFDQKKIDFAHLMNSELYEDDKILGLEKKPKSKQQKESEKGEAKDEKSEEKNDEKSDLVEKNLELLFNSSVDNNVSPTNTDD